MSTRSQIGVKNLDGSIEIVYCHSDGYFSHNGQMLFTHHNNEAAARKIVSLGGVSFLDERLEPSGPHSFDYSVREAGCSTFYARDRGDAGGLAEKDVHPNFNDYAENGNHQEYAYLYDVGRKAWIASDLDGSPWTWYLLEDLENIGWVSRDEDGDLLPNVPTIIYDHIEITLES